MQSNIVAIILGASSWPKSDGRWPKSPCFKNSAHAFLAYLKSAEGLFLDKNNILFLFDDTRSASEIDEEIENFLTSISNRLGAKNTDIVFFYTGHGAFTEGDQKYCLAMRSTRIDALGQSGYRVASIARTLNKCSADARKFVIIDACFAAASQADFIPQSDVASRMEEQTMDVMVESGTALLCASSSSDVALAPKDEKFTMFSGALLQSLTVGSVDKPESLSFDDIAAISDWLIRQKFRTDAVRPEVHVPDQRRGDLSTFPFFPNPARLDKDASLQEVWKQEVSTKTNFVREQKNSTFWGSVFTDFREPQTKAAKILLAAFIMLFALSMTVTGIFSLLISFKLPTYDLLLIPQLGAGLSMAAIAAFLRYQFPVRLGEWAWLGGIAVFLLMAPSYLLWIAYSRLPPGIVANSALIVPVFFGTVHSITRANRSRWSISPGMLLLLLLLSVALLTSSGQLFKLDVIGTFSSLAAYASFIVAAILIIRNPFQDVPLLSLAAAVCMISAVAGCSVAYLFSGIEFAEFSNSPELIAYVVILTISVMTSTLLTFHFLKKFGVFVFAKTFILLVPLTLLTGFVLLGSTVSMIDLAMFLLIPLVAFTLFRVSWGSLPTLP